MSCATMRLLPQHCTQVERKQSKRRRGVMWYTHTHLAATDKEMKFIHFSSGLTREGRRARSLCTKTALTLIYISRNTAARGEGAWDYGMHWMWGSGSGNQGEGRRTNTREGEKTEGGIWSADYAEHTELLAEKAKTFTNHRAGGKRKRGGMRGGR